MRQFRPTYLSGHSKLQADRRQGKSAVSSLTRTSLLSRMTLRKALSSPYLIVGGEGTGPWRSKVLSIQVQSEPRSGRALGYHAQGSCSIPSTARKAEKPTSCTAKKTEKPPAQRKASSFLSHSRFKRFMTFPRVVLFQMKAELLHKTYSNSNVQQDIPNIYN